MNQNILKLAQLAMKRPADRTISLLRVCMGIVVFVVIFVFADAHMIDIFGWNPDAQTEVYVEYGLLVFALLPILHGALRLCIVKHATLKKLQLAFAVALIVIGGPMLDPDTRTVEVQEVVEVAEAQELGAQVAAPESDMAHNPSWILVVLSLLPLFFGITGKGTYSHCIKYKEVIKKIRV